MRRSRGFKPTTHTPNGSLVYDRNDRNYLVLVIRGHENAPLLWGETGCLRRTESSWVRPGLENIIRRSINNIWKPTLLCVVVHACHQPIVTKKVVPSSCLHPSGPYIAVKSGTTYARASSTV